MSSKLILDYWEDSFKLLKWDQLKMYLLAGLNNMLKSTTTTFHYCWWLVPFIVFPIFYTVIAESTFALSLLESIVMIVALNILFFIYILSSRASLERKDYAYFTSYLNAALGVSCLVFISNLFYGIGVVPLLGTYFYLDSKFSFREFLAAILNSIKVLVYFPAIIIPFIFLNWLSFSFFAFIIPTTLYNLSFVRPVEASSNIAYFIMLLMPYSVVSSVCIITFIFIFLSFFQLSLMSIFYTKIKHTYPDLFLGQ